MCPCLKVTLDERRPNSQRPPPHVDRPTYTLTRLHSVRVYPHFEMDFNKTYIFPELQSSTFTSSAGNIVMFS